jgi:hypothetical protein
MGKPLLLRRNKMKTYRWFIVFAVLALMLSLSAFSVGAAATDTTGAPYVDNTTPVVGPNGTVWYRFEYTGDHSQINIKLVDAIRDSVDRGLSFEVYTPSQIKEWWKNDGIGAGNPKGDDLIWTGNAHEAGTWWIKVNNTKPTEMPFDLIVSGEKVSFAPPTAPVAEVTLPSAKALVENAVPDLAVPVKADAQVLPAGATAWYRFPYSGAHDQITLNVPNGADENLRVYVLTPEQVETWWNSTPVGQATPKDGNLLWSGNAEESGVWYIKVVNDNLYAVSLQMLLDIQDRNVR